MRQAEHSRRSQHPPLAEAARAVLEGHTHFRGRADRFAFEEVEGGLVVVGTVPTFYLKQLLQSLLKDIEGVQRIVNRVDVVSSAGLSSCSHATGERCALGRLRPGGPECFPTCQATENGSAALQPPPYVRQGVYSNSTST
jgi:hypothetical protein